MTVIVPVYNRPEMIVRCLDSIARQSRMPSSLIVVDNASTDDTPMAIDTWIEAHRDLPMEVKRITEVRPGAARARQTGFEHVATEYVLFFDSDDVMASEYVAKAEEALDSGTVAAPVDVAVWRVRYNFADGRSEVTHGVEGNLTHAHMVHALLRTEGYACRREFMQRVGGWNTRLRGWDDWELGVRILLHQPRIAEVDVCMSDVYVHDNSITGADFGSKQGEWEMALDEAERAVYAISGLSDADETDRNPEVISKSRHTQLVAKLLRYIMYRRVILAAHYRYEGHKDAARRLLQEINHNRGIFSPLQRLFVRWAYHHTSRGRRGAGRVAKYLF